MAEIIAAGGTAVASAHSVVEDGAAIIELAVTHFGRVDILINNAGIAFPRAFDKYTREEWKRMLDVHVHGAFLVTQAAWPVMKKQGYGRIVMTSSPAGLFGTVGAAAYATAKMGLVGMANALQVEGRRYGIRVNTIAPQADTRTVSVSVHKCDRAAVFPSVHLGINDRNLPYGSDNF